MSRSQSNCILPAKRRFHHTAQRVYRRLADQAKEIYHLFRPDASTTIKTRSRQDSQARRAAKRTCTSAASFPPASS